MSVLRNTLLLPASNALGISLQLQAFPFHSSKVFSPWPQLIRILKPISICLLGFCDICPYQRMLENRKPCSIRLWMGYQTYTSKPNKEQFWVLHCVCFIKYIFYRHCPKCLLQELFQPVCKRRQEILIYLFRVWKWD